MAAPNTRGLLRQSPETKTASYRGIPLAFKNVLGAILVSVSQCKTQDHP
jgi:hypothetical protein